MRRTKAVGIAVLVGIVFFVQALNLESYAAPRRGVKLTTKFPRVGISGERKVTLTINVINEGSKDELLDLTATAPEGWEVELTYGGYVVKSIYLTGNQSRILDFEASPQPGVKAGSYTFLIKATSRDGAVYATLNVQIEITGETAPAGITLDTPYPSVDSPSGKDNEFRVTVRNRGGEDRVIDFYAIHPRDWKVTFKPVYEDKLVHALDFKADESKSLKVTVSPPPNEEPGNYNITLVAESGTLKGNLSLSLNIVGTYELGLSTSDGRLTLDAVQGKETPLTLTLDNRGTAPLKNVRFYSGKPIGWDVVFEPDKVDLMSPAYTQEIRVTIKPPSDAIPGDYMVTLRSTAEPYQTSDSLELRVTVRGSMAWGLVGAVIIAVVTAGLIGMFWRLGRR